MKPVLERATETLAIIQPILKENFVDIGAEAFLDPDGKIKAKIVWLSTAPKADEVPAPLKTEEAK